MQEKPVPQVCNVGTKYWFCWPLYLGDRVQHRWSTAINRSLSPDTTICSSIVEQRWPPFGLFVQITSWHNLCSLVMPFMEITWIKSKCPYSICPCCGCNALVVCHRLIKRSNTLPTALLCILLSFVIWKWHSSCMALLCRTQPTKEAQDFLWLYCKAPMIDL